MFLHILLISMQIFLPQTFSISATQGPKNTANHHILQIHPPEQSAPLPTESYYSLVGESAEEPYSHLDFMHKIRQMTSDH